MRNAIPPFWNQGQAMKLHMRAALGTHTAFLPDNYLGRNSFSLFLSILWPDQSWVLFYKLKKIQQELNLPLILIVSLLGNMLQWGKAVRLKLFRHKGLF